MTWEWILIICGLVLLAIRNVPTLTHWLRTRFGAAPTASAPTTPASIAPAEPRLTFVIDQVYEREQPAEQAPYHAPGGDWTFFDAHLESGARFGFGWTYGPPGERSAFGKALWTVPNPSSGAELVTVFARVFGGKLPATEPSRPLAPQPFALVALAGASARDEHGSFSGVGTWTASKLFLQRPGIEAEVFFNYDLVGKSGEFTEKDDGYANHLLAFMARELRDGPLAPQTPDNDPRISLIGPKLGALRPLGPPGATFRGFAARGTRVIYSVVEGPGTRIMSAPCDGLMEEQELISLERGFGSLACTETGDVCLVEQIPQRDTDSWSSADPHDFFWVQKAPKRIVKLSGPWGRSASPTKVALSPDGKFSALEYLVENPREMPSHSVLYFVDADDPSRSASYSQPPNRLDVVGWQGAAEALRAIVRDKPRRGEFQHFWLVDPRSGAATQLAESPISEDPALSPDGKHRYSSNNDEELVITAVATGVTRKFPVAPRERYNFDGSEPRWYGSRYLQFSPERIGFIDIDSLKLSFFLEQDSKFDTIEFEPTLTWAVVADEPQLKIAGITIR